MARSLSDISKTDFTSNVETFEAINCGSIQRIAAACELMAKNHAQLVRERDTYERMYREARACSERLSKRLSCLRGVITRMKKQNRAEAR